MSAETRESHKPGPWDLHDYGDSWLVNNERWGVHIPKFAHADARLIAAAPDGLEAAEGAYLWLLTHLVPGSPHYTLRIQAQAILCNLRDFIAAATGLEPREVQSEYEGLAELANATP